MTYNRWQDIANNINRDEFNNWWRTHTHKEALELYNLSAKGFQTLLKFWNIPKKTKEEKAYLNSRGGKGRRAWNKGLKKGDPNYSCDWITDDVRKRKSDSMKGKNSGRVFSEQSKKNMSEGCKKLYASGYKKVLTEAQYEALCIRNRDPKQINKIFETKRKNGTLNTSEPEDNYYEYLCKYYGVDNVKRNYNDDSRYPWHCDFYIPSEDLFIELNLFYMHGGHPFDYNNEEDIKQLEFIRSKQGTYIDSNGKEAKNSYYTYEYVWTDLDVRKRNTAKQNNLNYVEVFKLC